jgi:hypothetical protein
MMTFIESLSGQVTCDMAAAALYKLDAATPAAIPATFN